MKSPERNQLDEAAGRFVSTHLHSDDFQSQSDFWAIVMNARLVGQLEGKAEKETK